MLQFLQDLMSSLNVTPINTDNPDSLGNRLISETQLISFVDVLGRLATEDLVEELRTQSLPMNLPIS